MSSAPVDARRPPRRLLEDATLAVSLLTIAPVPRLGGEVSQLGRAATWFPVVGALVGALAGAVRMLAQPLLGPLPATALSLAALVAATGALHQDGLADTADGVGARGTPEQRLTAMRDSSIGAFGVLALVWWSLLMLTTLSSLSALNALAALVAAGAVSRWAALLHAIGAPPARMDGLGASFHVSGPSVAVAGVVALAGTAALRGPLPALAAVTAGVCAAGATTALARHTLGGRTGDTLGATVAGAELAVCVVLLAAAPHA